MPASARRLLDRLGFPGQLGLIVTFFVATVVFLVAVVAAAFGVMSGVRAYVGGEGLWSKAEKGAVWALDRAAAGDPSALVPFDALVAVPLGDRVARRELARAAPNDVVVAEGFIAGRNHPEDIPSMSMVVRRLYWAPHVARALAAWTRADREIMRLVALAEHMRSIDGGSPRTVARLRRKVAALDARLTPLEDAFSANLSDGARLLRRVLLIAITGAALALLALGLALSRLVLIAVRDGAARQRCAAAALRSSEERYRELFDNANDLVYAHDLDGRVTSANQACLRATGHLAHEIVGHDVGAILTPDSRARVRAMTAHTIDAGGSTVYELDILARDGRTIPVEVSTRLVLDGGVPVAVHSTARDVSERKRAGAALAEEARVTAALARVGRDLMSSLDTPVLFERLCRVTMEVLRARTSLIALWQPEPGRWVHEAMLGDAPADVAHTLDRAGNPAAIFHDDVAAALAPRTLAIAIRRASETVGALLVSADAPFSPADRRIAEGVATTVSLALANADLVAQLEAASRLRSEFVSTMSHELRTPLNVMLGYIEMLRDEGEEQARWDILDRMEASGHDLLDLIESTLDLGRIEAGRDAVRPETISLRTLLLAVGGSCARFPRRQSVELRWPVDPADCHITTDPRKITVVLRNLVGNALKFTERGFVELRVAVTTDRVILTVHDTGIGIRRDEQERVFDMFRQADGSDSRRFGGTGLGLYIVRRYVSQLGGTVMLDSEPGRGSRFVVSLPRDVDFTRAAA